MGVSKLGPMDLMFIDAKVKINSAYYRVLLTQKLMPDMPEICGKFFIFQQGKVPAYRACETISLLKRDTCVHFTRLFATKQHRSERSSLKIVITATAVLQAHDVDEPKQQLIDVSHHFEQSVIDDSVDQRRKCLCAWIRVKWKPFEHLI